MSGGDKGESGAPEIKGSACLSKTVFRLRGYFNNETKQRKLKRKLLCVVIMRQRAQCPPSASTWKQAQGQKCLCSPSVGTAVGHGVACHADAGSPMTGPTPTSHSSLASWRLLKIHVSPLIFQNHSIFQKFKLSVIHLK